MTGRLIHTWLGPLAAVVEQRDGRWYVRFRDHHPLLTAIKGAIGDTEDEALAVLAGAVHTSGSTWPDPPRRDLIGDTEDGPRYVRAERVDQVLVATDDGDRLGWAVGWRGDQVWIKWHEGLAGSTAWVAADRVRRA